MTIQQSEKLGIAFVHQELNLFNDLKVYENIFLMKEYKKENRGTGQEADDSGNTAALYRTRSGD